METMLNWGLDGLTLNELVSAYAMRAREFSDAVASLGRQTCFGPEFSKMQNEIKRRLALCSEAGNRLASYTEQSQQSSLVACPSHFVTK